MPATRSSLLRFALIAPLIAGCGADPPSPAEVRASISSDLGRILNQTDAAITEAGITQAAIARSVSAALSFLAVADPIARAVALATTDVSYLEARDPDAIVAWLNDQLFTDANYIGGGIYRAPAALVCGEVAIDDDCTTMFAELDPKVRTHRDGDTMVFTLQITDDHHEPLVARLNYDLFAASLDLDELSRAIASRATNIALAGGLTASLEVFGPAEVVASLDVDRALSIKLADAGESLDGPTAFSLTSAKADAFSINPIGRLDALFVFLDVGNTRIVMPQDGQPPVELDLPGLSAQVRFVAHAPTVMYRVGLGDRTTKISLGGAVAQTIDLNAETGRRFGVTVTEDRETGSATLTLHDSVELAMTTDHDLLGQPPPVYDVTRISLTGSLVVDGNGRLFELRDGSFGAATAPPNYGFSAGPGQCVTGSDEIDLSSGLPFTRWAVAVCQ